MKKNHMLKAIFAVIAGVLISGSAMAQEHPQQGQKDRQEQVEKQTEHLKKRLTLTPEQVAQLDEINKSNAVALTSLRNDQNMNRQTKMERLKGLRDERETAIKSILSEEQRKTFEVMLQNQENRQSQRQGNRKGRS